MDIVSIISFTQDHNNIFSSVLLNKLIFSRLWSIRYYLPSIQIGIQANLVDNGRTQPTSEMICKPC